MNPVDVFCVRVSCMTYNQSRYIIDALNGFTMQKTAFPFVCTIVDDASTDGEQEVIKAYLNKHFAIQDVLIAFEKEEHYGHVSFARHKTNMNCYFAVVYLKENHYSRNKSKAVYLEEWADTKYVALCEGDDYWTDPLKLQKQVDILEKDVSLSAVVTNSLVVNEECKPIRSFSDNVVKDNIEGRYDLRDFFHFNHRYPTATVLYRNEYSEEIGRMQKMTSNPFLGDWTLWIILHTLGDFYYLNQITAAYRINPTSVTHSNFDERRLGLAKANFAINKAVQDILPQKYEDIKKDLDNTAWIWFNLANAYKHSHKYLGMTYALIRCFFRDPSFFLTKIRNCNKNNKELR